MQQFRETTRKFAARAKEVLLRTVSERVSGGCEVSIEWVRRTGSGRSRDIFAAHVDVEPDPDGLAGVYVVMIPRRAGDARLVLRTRWEAEVLARLAEESLSFRVPEVLAAIDSGDDFLLIRRFLDGVPLDMRVGRQEGVLPWEVVGRVAAAVHRIDASRWSPAPGHADRREHAREKLASFDGLEGPEIDSARLWATENVPRSEPAVLVHGDLLGQNILLAPGEPAGVIDWEYSLRGDPAYDLAIVTRGIDRPFHSADGLDRLLEAYHDAGGRPMTERDVRYFELCLAAKWYRQAQETGQREPVARARKRLEGLLERLP